MPGYMTETMKSFSVLVMPNGYNMKIPGKTLEHAVFMLKNGLGIVPDMRSERSEDLFGKPSIIFTVNNRSFKIWED